MDLSLQTTTQSWIEVFIAARRLVARDMRPSTSTVDQVVRELFVLVPDHPKGRIRAFRNYGQNTTWASIHDTGRSTVWNMATRKAEGTAMFVDAHIKKGLRDDAMDVFISRLPADEHGAPQALPLDPLAVLLLRDRDWPIVPDSDQLREELAALLALESADIDRIAVASPLGTPLLESPPWSPETVSAAFPLPDTTPGLPGGGPPGRSTAHRLGPPIRLDDRTMRMVRVAIASARAVLLVGPPGTGKTEILDQVLTEVANDPTRFGLEVPSIDWVTLTPEEEWTFDKLVVGQSVRNGAIVLEPGVVPQAIQNEQWVVLDEMNRADMDRVFGGLLTWLSGKRVKVEDRKDKPGAVYLDWNDEPEGCVIDPDDEPGDIEYLAGRDWRLLGTYNAVDAQKVFRLGQALGRRFKHIPIPPASTGQFEVLVNDRCSDAGVGVEVGEVVLGLYEAHLKQEDTTLGPALFLDIPAYVGKAMMLADIAKNGDGSDPSATDLIAEAYVASVGNLIAKVEPDQMEALRADALDLGALDEAQWDWVMAQLSSLRA